MPDPNEERLKFLFNTSAIEVPQAKEGEKRTFKGTAYSGGRVDGHWYWGRTGVVFDLEGIEIDSPTALLEEHFGSNRIGVVKKVDTNGKIDVEGHFLTNERAKEIVQDSDDEFPFQMSMFIDPGSVEEVNTGQTVVVNGQSFTGPIAVFRNNRIREFTICSTGADRNTSIKAFSGKPNFNQPPEEDTNVTEIEKAQQAKQQAEKERDDALGELKQFKAQKRADEIAALETELKTQFSAEDKTAYTNMDDSVFAFTAKQLRQFSAGGQQPPVGQQQQQTPSVNPALNYLFNHQATSGQGGQAPQGSALDQAFAKFAAAQESK
ncbi:hypothetical protein ACN6TW_11655 [Acinetobacter radioresistens]|uniref:Capsid maturation protease n=1 Tax=Acinetobacter radioresistens SK82 TaxID=596318 RepID=A0ABM9YRZ4_ACIRA|nr:MULTISPECIES: hypothetical protein [Acinetobacter]EET83958.1 hypothetical protein ACIRA0001_2828 [Acinetobacter radioresistens SK82]EEY87435.1 hypothetical protein HMPREF0018_00182 [Acinetobacter radioresistens SH164]EXB80767.1 hypothetical protein J538_2883 [Acinetobacter sp. 272263]EXE55404.1 hypothetical protein J579_3077 [Acinetobacter sp. 1239920]MCK4095813.1 hypothetical protein [Acinetobacter radioresistens]